MKNTENNNLLIVFGLFIFASFIRIVLNSNTHIIKIIGIINIIAFWYVLYLILESSFQTFVNKLKNNSIIGENIKIKKLKHIKKFLLFCKIFSFLSGLIYVFFFANSIINDIISLGALFLSIETENIYQVIQNYFYQKK